MTKYVILSDNNLYKNVKHMKDFDATQVLVGKIDGAKIEKIFHNPITALAYDAPYNQTDFMKKLTMDKKDIIKAIDFWINAKVLENEQILKLTDRLNDVEEIELKKLIEIRTTVEKLPVDTVFKRFNNHGNTRDGYDNKYLFSQTVDFYYEVKRQERPPQPKHDHIDMFGNNSWNSPGRWYWSSNAGWGGEMLGYFSTDDQISPPTIRGGRHSDSFEREYSLSYTGNATAPTSTPTPRAPSLPRVVNPNPHTWRVVRMGAERGRWMVCDDGGNIISRNFRSQGTAQAYIRVRLDNSLDSVHFNPNLPATLGTEQQQEPEGHLLATAEGTGSHLIGTAGEDLRPGDLLVTDPDTGRFVKARPNEPSMNSNHAHHINIQSTSEGQPVEAVREGTFIYPSGYTPTLRPGDSVSSNDRGNTLVIRRSRETISSLLSNIGAGTQAMVDNITNAFNHGARAMNDMSEALRAIDNPTQDLVEMSVTNGSGTTPITMTHQGWSNYQATTHSINGHSEPDRLEIFRNMDLRQRNIINGGMEVRLEFVGPTEHNNTTMLRTIRFTIRVARAEEMERFRNPEPGGADWRITLHDETTIFISHLTYRLISPIHIHYDTIGNMANGIPARPSLPNDTSGVPYLEFPDMYVNRVNVTASSIHNRIEIEFRGRRGNLTCEFEARNNNSFPNWNREQEDNPHMVKILGNHRVDIDGVVYTVLNHITVDYSRVSILPFTYHIQT